MLIIWDHEEIPVLVNTLGVKDKLPEWPGDVFDSVYVLDYNKDTLQKWQRLDKQYPIKHPVTWENIANLDEQ
jgi:hypothetical protein